MELNKVLLDTNILIGWIRSRDKKFTSKIEAVTYHGFSPIISAVTLAELYSGLGMNDPDEKRYIQIMLEGFEVLIPDQEIFKKAGEIIRKSKYSIDLGDATIAATCLIHNLSVFTLNYKHFKGIEGLKVITEKTL